MLWAVTLNAAAAAMQGGPAVSHKPAWLVRWQPARVVNGSPLLLTITPPQKLAALSGKWLEHEIFFYFDAPSKTWRGLAGASLETKPAKYPLTLTGKTKSGREVSFQREISVGKAKYRQISVTVPKQYTQPSPEQQKEIAEEQELKHKVLPVVSPEREWKGRFLPPATAPISDVFGTARVFNGETQSVHQGLDFGVPSGTPVHAINAGTVILAQPLFFEGNMVVIDHGQGLLTLYMHLSKLEVKQGDSVKRGEEIALSGGTGRATGPHLHLAVRWQGVYLDPATLLGLKIQ